VGNETLTATITPSDANQTVIWSSNNEAIATVDATTGNVTAKGLGTATITATTVDGNHSATCLVVITDVYIPTFTNQTLAANGDAIDYNFNMTWIKIPTGLTLAQGLQNYSTVGWKSFFEKFNPRPHIGSGSTSNYKVFAADGKLTNSSSHIVIQRYWSQTTYAGGTTPLTVANWTSNLAARKTAFNAAAANIQTMMTEIASSPLYNPSSPLKTIHDAMERFIKAPTTLNPAANESFNTTGTGTNKEVTHLIGDYATGEGILYEFFFGHIPIQSEYANTSNVTYTN
jgi:hypothetical protein